MIILLFVTVRSFQDSMKLLHSCVLRGRSVKNMWQACRVLVCVTCPASLRRMHFQRCSCSENCDTVQDGMAQMFRLMTGKDVTRRQPSSPESLRRLLRLSFVRRSAAATGPYISNIFQAKLMKTSLCPCASCVPLTFLLPDGSENLLTQSWWDTHISATTSARNQYNQGIATLRRSRGLLSLP